MSDPDLGGSVAVVTGGGSGIGHAIAVSLAARGVRCALVGRREETLEAGLGALATPGTAVVADVAEQETHSGILEQTEATLGSVDILVHAAGLFEKQPIEDTTDEFWDGILAVNLTAVMALTRAAWPTLCGAAGQVVLIGSIAASQAFAGNAAYAASKAGMEALGGVLALEGRDHGVRVLTVNPAQTDTGLWEGKAPPEVRERMMSARSVGGLTAALIATDRAIEILPVTVQPLQDPWQFEDRLD